MASMIRVLKTSTFTFFFIDVMRYISRSRNKIHIIFFSHVASYSDAILGIISHMYIFKFVKSYSAICVSLVQIVAQFRQMRIFISVIRCRARQKKLRTISKTNARDKSESSRGINTMTFVEKSTGEREKGKLFPDSLRAKRQKLRSRQREHHAHMRKLPRRPFVLFSGGESRRFVGSFK